MIKRLSLSHDQAINAVENGGFSDDITASDDAVVLVLTQSWCPQWAFMNRSIIGLGDGPEDLSLTIYVYEYDRSPHFNRFMTFKESVYRNWQVPYVRLYRKGQFVSENNAMPAGRMIEALRKAV